MYPRCRAGRVPSSSPARCAVPARLMDPLTILLTGFGLGVLTDRLLVLLAHRMTRVPTARR